MVQGFLDDISMSARFYDKKRKSVKNLLDCYFNILLAITAWFMHACSQKKFNFKFPNKKKIIVLRIFTMQKCFLNSNYDMLTFSIVIIWLCTVRMKQLDPVFSYRSDHSRNIPALNTAYSHRMLRTILFFFKSTRLYTRGTTPSFFSLFNLDWFGSDKKRSARKINFLTFSFHLNRYF